MILPNLAAMDPHVAGYDSANKCRLIDPHVAGYDSTKFSSNGPACRGI